MANSEQKVARLLVDSIGWICMWFVILEVFCGE